MIGITKRDMDALAALQEGYTRDEAFKLLEIHALYSIRSSVEH